MCSFIFLTGICCGGKIDKSKSQKSVEQGNKLSQSVLKGQFPIKTFVRISRDQKKRKEVYQRYLEILKRTRKRSFHTPAKVHIISFMNHKVFNGGWRRASTKLNMYLQLFHLLGQTFQVVRLCKLSDWLKTLQIGTDTLKALTHQTDACAVCYVSNSCNSFVIL